MGVSHDLACHDHVAFDLASLRRQGGARWVFAAPGNHQVEGDGGGGEGGGVGNLGGFHLLDLNGTASPAGAFQWDESLKLHPSSTRRWTPESGIFFSKLT